MQIVLNKLLPHPIAELDYRDSQIWDAPEVVFRSGELVLLKANSGKGKTTLLHTIYGLRNDFSGEVKIDNVEVGKISKKQWSNYRQRSISMVFQGLRLFSELTALENINLKKRLTKNYTETEIFDIACVLEIDMLLGKKIKYLSYGQQQRVAILRALCQPFYFLLLDEPFSHLDRPLTETAFNILEKECRQRKAGMLITSLYSMDNINFDNTYII